MPEPKKICKKCLAECPISNFAYGKHTPDRTNVCVYCTRKREAAWRAANPARYKERVVAHHKEHHQELVEYWKARYRSNSKEILAKNKEHRSAHKSDIVARRLRYKQKDPARFKELVRASYERRRVKILAAAVLYTRNRRAKIKQAEGKHAASDIKSLYASQSGKCGTCQKDLASGYEVDHIMPIALGGSNWPNNLQLLCSPCNRRKNKKHPDEWARLSGRSA